jgi:hypothetical protein
VVQCLFNKGQLWFPCTPSVAIYGVYFELDFDAPVDGEGASVSLIVGFMALAWRHFKVVLVGAFIQALLFVSNYMQ